MMSVLPVEVNNNSSSLVMHSPTAVGLWVGVGGVGLKHTYPVEVVGVSTFGEQAEAGFNIVCSHAGVQFLRTSTKY